MVRRNGPRFSTSEFHTLLTLLPAVLRSCSKTTLLHRHCNVALLLPIVWLTATVPSAAAEVAPALPNELLVPLPEGGSVALSTRGPSAFRARFFPDADTSEDRPLPPPIDSPMVHPDSGDVQFRKFLWTDFEGKACRYNSTDTSRDGLGTTRNETSATLDECLSLCEQAKACSGVEWRMDDKRCEFWTEPIGAVVPLKGHHCFNFTHQASSSRGISVVGLGSLSVSHEGELILRSSSGSLVMKSEPVGNPQRPPHALAATSHPGGWFQGTEGEVGNEQLWSGDAIYLKAHTGRYLQPTHNKVFANSLTRDISQQLIVETKGGSGLVRHGDIVYLHTHSGTTLQAEDNQLETLEVDVQGPWQEFIIERKYGEGVVLAGDHVFFKANQGQYVDVEDIEAAARFETAGIWQTLQVEKAAASLWLRSGDGLFLEPAHGKLLEASDDGVAVKESLHSPAQRWVIERKDSPKGARILSGDAVFLRTLAGTYLHLSEAGATADWDGNDKLKELVIEREAGDGPVQQSDRIKLMTPGGLYAHVDGEALGTSKSGLAMTIETRISTCTQTYALNGTSYASDFAAGYEPWRAVDGDPSSSWVGNASRQDSIWFDLGDMFTLSRVEMRWGAHFARSYLLEGSSDGKQWESFALALGREGWVVTVLPQASRARWVRLRQTALPLQSGLFELRDVAFFVCQKTLALSTAGGVLYGKGAAINDAHRLTSTSTQPQVCNCASFVPYYWSTDGYAALGVVSGTDNPRDRRVYPASYTSDGKWLSWGFLGSLELYIMPAASLSAGTQAYMDLTGVPRMPPRYAFGFLASKWGWGNSSDIKDTVQSFRTQQFPIDAVVMDYEWYSMRTDRGFSPHGESWFEDFGIRKDMFADPNRQLRELRSSLKVHLGAIRKPRLGNDRLLDQAHRNGWLLPGGLPGGKFPPDIDRSYSFRRNLDFSKTEVRDWYARQLLHLIGVGLDFWWNDEGETEYFTYQYWNEAEVQALRSSANSSRDRFFSLNSAFSPGLARLGAAVWTGDVDASWEDLRRTPGTMLNLVLAGAPYVACDIGGYAGETQPELLLRWMQVGTFMPLMRVHSWRWSNPHWPWLYGAVAADAMKKAMELRYRLLPYHYSLAHALYKRRQLWIQPLVTEFPDDEYAASLTTQWLDGSLMVAPILSEDSRRKVYLPAGEWYHFNTSHMEEGPTHLGGLAEEDEIPIFVRPGAVICLGDSVQSTYDFAGGAIEIQVYTGADGSFELVEDDGASVNYEVGRVRTTTFRWYDSARTLSWRAQGSAGDASDPGAHPYTRVSVRLFDGRMQSSVFLEQRDLQDGGTITAQELSVHRELQV
mmetsp:Transcript_56516/g.123584  ORF Transcript_56516/g.123584 Transcript_56516/m.123584 type:complete len:1328 (-) Transcript_56516:77-4060(-)